MARAQAEPIQPIGLLIAFWSACLFLRGTGVATVLVAITGFLHEGSVTGFVGTVTVTNCVVPYQWLSLYADVVFLQWTDSSSSSVQRS